MGMLRQFRSWLRTVLSPRQRASLRSFVENTQIQSIRQALKEQGLSELYNHLVEIVPDIRYQYTSHELETEYLCVKVRALHTFQVSLVQRALALLQVEPAETLTVVDIGDSAGTHIQYLRGLYKNLRSLSVNIDRLAVDKIRQKGLEAIHARAEETERYNINPDIFLLFETLEHLLSPIHILRSLTQVDTCRMFVITVPYVAQSRIGLQYIRRGTRDIAVPERVHIFELCPDDWQLIFQLSGWKVLQSRIYLQYPKWHPLYFTKVYWRVHDFEGFYGAVLARDDTWSSLYQEN